MQRKILISILVLIALILSFSVCYANVDDNGVDESSIMNEKYETYKDCYKDLLNLYFEKAPESEYFSVDINQDEVEEIFITTGESEAEKIMSVYTFGKYLKYLGTTWNNSTGESIVCIVISSPINS